MVTVEFIATYGYLALIIGLIFEGEVVLVLAGFLAHQGYLSLPLVISISFIVSSLLYQLIFFLGRFKGKSFLKKYKSLKPEMKKADILLAKHDKFFILGFRFMYGLRMVSSFIIGLSNIKIAEFTILNIIGAFIWFVTIGVLGYMFGATINTILDKIGYIEKSINIGLIILAVIIIIIWSLRSEIKKVFNNHIRKP